MQDNSRNLQGGSKYSESCISCPGPRRKPNPLHNELLVKSDVTTADALPRTSRFHHVYGIASLAPFVRVVRWKYDRWLRDAILVEDKGKQIVAITFALETESPLRFFVGDICPNLRGALLLTCLDHSFL